MSQPFQFCCNVGLVSVECLPMGQAGGAQTIVKDWTSEALKETRCEEVKPFYPISASYIYLSTRLRDLKPSTMMKKWLAQIEATTVQFTSVTLNRIDGGVEIVLDTQHSKPLQVDATNFHTQSNSLIADISHAVLALPDGQPFRADNPTSGIADVQVTQLDANNIRVWVTGNNALPAPEVRLKLVGLAYSLNPAGEIPEAELIVMGESHRVDRILNPTTATKTRTPPRDISQSIQVVPPQVIRAQNVIRASDALKNISGLVISRNSSDSGLRKFTIRGFSRDEANEGDLRNGLRDFADSSAL